MTQIQQLHSEMREMNTAIWKDSRAKVHMSFNPYGYDGMWQTPRPFSNPKEAKVTKTREVHKQDGGRDGRTEE